MEGGVQMALPEGFIAELKSRNSIADVIGSYVPVKKMGRNLKCKCPFHNETDASLVVYTDSQSFYCFGCGVAGDVISFVRKIENLNYIEAVHKLAERANLEVPEQDGRYAQAGQDRKRVIEINKVAAHFFYDCLLSDEGKGARDYLKGRKLSAKTITRFGLGYAPDSWDRLTNFLLQKGYTENELTMAAVAVKGRQKGVYDQFRARIIFPIINVRGEVIGFGGRIMEGKGPKYLNSADTPAFKKSRNLFAMNIAKSSRQKRLILAEGYMDVIALHQADFDNAVATLGTALTSEQAYLISNYTEEVVISYDSDSPGQAAAKRAASVFEKTPVQVRILEMIGAKDPDEYIVKYSAERYAILVENSAAAPEYFLGKIRGNYVLETPEGQVGYLREAAGYLRTITDAGVREIYAARLAQELSLEKDTVVAQVRGREQGKKAARPGQNTPSTQSGADRREDAGPITDQKARKAEEILIATLYRNPDYQSLYEKKLPPEYFVHQTNQKLYITMLEQMREGRLDISTITDSGKLTEEEAARLIYMINSAKIPNVTQAEVLEYINVLQERKNKKSANEIKEMDKDDLQAYIESLSSKKTGGSNV